MSASLSELQSWFLATMMTPGGAERGLALARERHGLGELDVLRAAGGARSRVHVYAQGYVLRLLECMRADYPVLCRTMGGELFDFFAKAYVWRHPSRSTTLYDLGAGFAEFLERSQPPDMAPAAALQSRFALDLARLERARSEAGRAPGLEPHAHAAPDSFTLLYGLDEAQVRLAPCTRLLAAAFPVHAYWDRAQQTPDDQALPVPAPAAVLLAVGRQHYRIGMHVLSDWQFHYLQAAASGAAAHASAHQAAQACGLPPGQVLADALLWLPQAAAAGLLSLDQVTAF
ncbi:HvfC/BufC N-terminal domain-containing protein [Massilia terrae]|uniref:DNA-binding domain-containing protein n=1 Tax=Massilia terrae TaxID=1811224 RepID=A0ABT2D3A6_9BURK|nr:DNA-binding domain-containing protein [Massilia terrae]MCS0660738.1 DNA-binding domain-containing protein [Massilia terrae]